MIFVNQGYLTISLATGVNLAGATNARIYYKKPTGVTGYWSASVSGSSVTYSFSNTDLDVGGTWRFQVYAEIGGETAYGEFVDIEVIPTI